MSAAWRRSRPAKIRGRFEREKRYDPEEFMRLLE